MQRGEFALLLVKHVSSPLAAVVATVGDMQWPVGKDSLVLKHENNRYSFSLPAALTYAVTFSSPDTLHLQQLDSLLRQYSTFAPRPPQAGTAGVAHAASEFWTTFASNTAVKDSTSHAMPEPYKLLPKTDSGNMSPKLAEKMQQARRMSAVQKLFARSVERGAINASTHVTVAEAADTSREQADTTKLAVATVDAVAKVVEAVESAGRTLLDSREYGQQQSKNSSESIDGAGKLHTSAWTLNKMGLRMLFRTIANIQTQKKTSHDNRVASTTQETSTDVQMLSSSSETSSSESDRLPPKFSPVASSSPWRVYDPLQNISVESIRSPPCYAVDNFPGTRARATSPLVVVPPWQSSLQGGAIRPLPLPPRFCGAAMPPTRLMGVIPAGAVPPAVPPGYRIPMMSQAEQSMSNPPPPPPPPHPRPPPPRPHNWPPPPRPHNWPI